MSRLRNDPRMTPFRFLPLVLTLGVVVGVAVGASSFFLLYRAEVEDEAGWLKEIARSQARFIEAMAAFDAEFSTEDDPGGGFGATLRKVRVAQERFGGWGKEGHLHLVALEGDTLVSLLGHRAEGSDAGGLDGHSAAMRAGLRRALSGESGTEIIEARPIVASLVAFEPVRVPGRRLGMVATMELAEIRSPFVRMALMVGLVTLSLVLGGGLVMRRLTEPARRRLIESERRYRRLFEDSGEAILLLTADGTILKANGAAEAMAGERGRTLVGRNALDFHPDPGEMSALLDLLRREGRVRGRELRFRREDGSEVTCLATIHLRKGNGAGPDRLETLLTDVTDLRDSQRTLAASEARLRSLYGSVQAGVLLQSAGGTILHANDVAAEILGMSPDQVRGRTAFDPAWEMTDEEGNPVTGEDHPSMITLRTGWPIRNAVRGIFSGDPARTRWLLINTEPLFEEGRDGVAEVVVTFVDITERRQAEEALRESRNRAQLYLDIADVMLVALDREGRIEMINGHGCEILDSAPENLLGMDWFVTCLPPAEVPRVREIFAALTAGRLRGVERAESLVRTRTGELRRIAWHNSIVRDERGQIVGTFSSGEDVTELRKSEAALREALEWQRAIIEGSADAIFISDEESRFVLVNGAAVELTGYPEEELLAMTIPHLHEKVDRAAYENHHDRIMGGEQVLTEAVILRSDGTKVEVEFNNRLLVIGGRAYMHTVARDLTERRTIELALRKSQERLSLAQEVAGIGFLYQEPSTGIEFWSPRTFELLGLDRSQTTASRDAFLSVLCPEDREAVLVRREKVERGEAVPPITFSVVHPGGDVRLVAERTSSFGGEGTSPLAIISVLRDITEEEVARIERELHAQRLQASEERFNLAQRVGRVGLLDRNVETGVEVWSDTTFEILGLDPAGTTPGPEAWMEAIHPEDRARAIRSLGRLLHGEDSPTEEYRVIHPTGEVRWITGTARIFPSREGKSPGRIVATVHDITDVKRAQEALLVSEERFRGIFEKSPLGIALRSPEGGLTAVNPEFCRILGYGEEELLGRDPLTLTHPADLEPSAELTRRMFLGEIPGFTVDKRYVRKSGEPVWCRLVATPVRDESGVVRHGLGVLQDITAERGAAEQLRISAERLRALAARLVKVREEERAALARELHDELGQALTGMRMDLALLRSGPPGARTDLTERLSSLIECTDASVELVRSISSRLRPPILDIMGLGPALEWQVDEHRPRTTTRFHVDVAGCPERLAKAHATAAFRIAQEALVNVLRHAEAENVWVTVREEEGFLILTVRDDGAGMPPDELFAPSSLGLLGMRERALSLGGEVAVESLLEGGTVVMARFPLVVEGDPAATPIGR
jgi:PAS domain S-box-containing protein